MKADWQFMEPILKDDGPSRSHRLLSRGQSMAITIAFSIPPCLPYRQHSLPRMVVSATVTDTTGSQAALTTSLSCRVTILELRKLKVLSTNIKPFAKRP